MKNISKNYPVLRFLTVVLLLLAAILPTLSCARKPAASATTTNQVATVQSGNLTVTIPETGNLALSQTQDLSFAMSGTVDQVRVQVGDIVTKGQILAALDATSWQDQLTSLEHQVLADQHNVLQSQISLENAQVALKKAMNTYASPEFLAAQADVDNAQASYEFVFNNLGSAGQAGGASTLAKSNLNAATTRLNALKSNATDQQIAVFQQQVTLAQGKIKDVQNALASDQSALDEAKSAGPQVAAPFDGFITNVYVTGGNQVQKGSIAVTLADSTKFEANVLVSEADINKVKLGSNATIQMNAMPVLNLPAAVSQIYPTATIQSSVVNYQVTVLVVSTQPQTRQGQGSLSRGGQAVQAITDVQLRSGLSVTVRIVVDQRTNVLLVPSRSITIRAGKTTVQLQSSSGAISTRAIQAGATDGTNTEVISGLSEGDKVVY